MVFTSSTVPGALAGSMAGFMAHSTQVWRQQVPLRLAEASCAPVEGRIWSQQGPLRLAVASCAPAEAPRLRSINGPTPPTLRLLPRQSTRERRHSTVSRPLSGGDPEDSNKPAVRQASVGRQCPRMIRGVKASADAALRMFGWLRDHDLNIIIWPLISGSSILAGGFLLGGQGPM